MTTRITVDLPDEQVSAAERAVAAGRAKSVSAYISAALEHTPEEAPNGTPGNEDLVAMLEEMDAEYGPPTPEAHAWARKALGLE